MAATKRICDVLIIGGGIAGMRAAISAHDQGMDVAVVSKVHPVRSASVGAQGGIASALNNLSDGDDWQKHKEDTLHSGGGLSDEDAVEILCREGIDAIRELDEMGVGFDRIADNKVAQRPYGGHSKARACYAGDKTGQTIVHTLWGQCLQREVRFYPEVFVWRLIMRDGRCTGTLALDMNSGELLVLSAKAVILATGGVGQLFEVTSNPFASTGDGLALSFAAGGQLRDMEFIQFHPTGLFPRGILISEACRAEGGYLVNNKGERFMFDYDKRGELATRDIVSRGIQTEIIQGRGLGGEACVGLDMRHLSKQDLECKLPQAVELARDLANIDLKTQVLPVAPTAHYFMGGIDVTLDNEVKVRSSAAGDAGIIKGLYAAGECACMSLHGANRLGCNSLLDGVVFGKRTGLAAARFAQENDLAGLGDDPGEQIHAEKRSGIETDQTPGQLKKRLQQSMSRNCGIFRTQERLAAQQGIIRDLEQQIDLVDMDSNAKMARSAIERKELANMLFVAGQMVKFALARKKSVGAHFRADEV